MSARNRKRPWLAVLLAFLYPGLGHVYLREWLRALVWFGLVVTSSTLLVPEGAVPTEVTFEALVAAARALPAEVTLALFSITFFSMVDAYWMAKQRNQAVTAAAGTTCPNCGREVDPELDFCHWCTESLGATVETGDDDSGTGW